MFTRGESTVVFAARAAVEAFVPALVGASAGLLGSIGFVRLFTPAGTIDTGVIGSAFAAAAIGTAVTLSAIAGGAAAAYARRTARSRSPWRRARSLPWELVVAAAALLVFFLGPRE